jgi:hypothetical protein
VSDKHFANVQLLCGFNGTDGATAFTDESSAARTATFGGNAQLDTAQSKWGSASLLVDGSGDFVSFPDAAAFTLGASDFTIECWARHSTIAAQFNGIGGQWLTTGNQRAWLFRLENVAAELQFSYTTNGSTPVTAGGAYVPLINTWIHYAVCRSGAGLHLFANGDQVGSTFNIAAASIFDSTTTVRVAQGSQAGTEYFNGWIDDFRITVGVARYTANFRPPQGPLDRRKNTGVLGDYFQPIVMAA